MITSREIENCIEMSKQFCPGLSEMVNYSNYCGSEDSDFWPSYCSFNELSDKLTETPIKQLQRVNCDVHNKPLYLRAFYLHEKEIMVFNCEINPSKRAYIKYLTQGKKFSIKDIARQCRVSQATVYRIKKDKIIDRDQRKEWSRDLGGRPRKLSWREERRILRTLSSLRHEEGNFTSIGLMARAGISPKHVSNRTIRRFLQRESYYFLQARKRAFCQKRT